ncbi:Uncharacterised protein [Mycobacteroides abscessus]|nr:Uncharacterised protein [Mycobacteroides abscessus]
MELVPGFQLETSAPVAVSNAARRYRVWPAISVNAPAT